ncbi:DEAD/DEAH box helicase [Sporosarcina cascadiensis]|uniref:DEAD/DEAH box helicase n=1 Tax=Sporosarcina cascadiensis TaxID=2660747 RepID=UPI00129A9918|nr:AAA domain-containing protein [Sporosarcina cascadiensis]
MMTVTNTIETISCGLEITKNARKGIEQWFLNEQALVSSETAFELYIEKKPANRQGNQSYSLYFDPKKNEKFAKTVSERVAVMECVLKPDGFVATGFHVRGAKEPVQTNRRLHTLIKFRLNKSGLALPIHFYTSMRELPVAEERSEYVKKRIESWEGYLQIAEKNADVEDLSCTFSQASFNSDFTKLHLHCKDLQSKNWRQLRGFSVKVLELSLEIGKVIDIQKSQRIIVVELNQRFQQQSRKEQWLPVHNKKLVLTNFAELSQIRRLRRGFKDLQDGLAANANLEKILFEERPVVQINNKQPILEFHNNLNAFQREAVTGAMKAHDLYVIQGPPGTGKTTVISEICYQNVKAGLRTLVASQSNLAVDNALGRLLTDPKTRILRYGRSESIEEEGKRFIEENVALHWRNETLETVQTTREMYKKKEFELSETVQQLEQRSIEYSEEQKVLAEQLELQNLLTQQLETQTSELAAKQYTLNQLSKKLSDQQNSTEQTQKKLDQQLQEIRQLQMKLSAIPTESSLTERLAILQNELEKLKQLCVYAELTSNLQQLSGQLNKLQDESASIPERENRLHAANEQIISISKLDRLQKELSDQPIDVPIQFVLQMNELQRLIKSIETGQFTYEFQEWKELYERFQTAIGKTEQLLQKHRFPIHMIEKKSTDDFKTIQEMHGMIDRLGRFLIKPAVKNILQIQEESQAKTEVLQTIAQGMSFFYSKEELVRMKGAEIQQQQKQLAKQRFAEIKQEVLKFFDSELKNTQRDQQYFQQQSERIQQQLAEKQRLLDEWLNEHPRPDIDWEKQQLLKEISTMEAAVSECGEQRKQLTLLAEMKVTYEQNAAGTQQTLEEQRKQISELEQQLQKRQDENMQLKTSIDELHEQLNPEVEQKLKRVTAELETAVQQMKDLNTERQQLPVLQELQAQWEQLLQQANDYDLDEIRKLYVEHANVIGTTCVASASKQFMEEYPEFDVVIIDEVSKATPPELLLPMLKGKKVILVGDHHQLPPLVGQETMDELVDQQKDPDVQREMKKLLNESLFERLFRTLPKQNKTMLSIQYRMHENIMQTISPFYKEGNYELQCGLPDSDELRDHLLESDLITRGDHLLWFDTPNEPAFYEDKVKGGTSRFNESELTLVRKILLDAEKATEEAKRSGRMDKNDLKSVGVISFYGEQVKQIDRMLQQELRPQHLHCRTGSVDKFQGMEMDIIVLSFVRNHGDSGGDIGFAKDYRRLNVALSRARELLIIVGSSEMFAVRTRNQSTRDMYSRLREIVQQQGGLRNVQP